MIGIGPGFRVGGPTTQGAWAFGCIGGRAVTTKVVGVVVATAGNGSFVVIAGCMGSRLVDGGCCEVVAATGSPGTTGTQPPGLFVVGPSDVTVVVSLFAE